MTESMNIMEHGNNTHIVEKNLISTFNNNSFIDNSKYFSREDIALSSLVDSDDVDDKLQQILLKEPPVPLLDTHRAPIGNSENTSKEILILGVQDEEEELPIQQQTIVTSTISNTSTIHNNNKLDSKKDDVKSKDASGSRCTSPCSFTSNSSSNHTCTTNSSVATTPVIHMNTVINNHSNIINNHHNKKTTPTKINGAGGSIGHGGNNSRMSTITSNSDIDILFSSLKNSITSKNSFVLGIHRHRSISNTTTMTSMTSDLSPTPNVLGSDINSDTLGRASAITITTSDINSSDAGAALLNQPSFNDLTTSCDTLTETDEEEELVESFLEDDENEDENDHHFNTIVQTNPTINLPTDEEIVINEKEFMKFQKQFLHHTNSSSSFIRTNSNSSINTNGLSSLNLTLNKSVVGGSLSDHPYHAQQKQQQNSDDTISTNTDGTSTSTSYRSAQNSVIYKPSLSSLSSSLISATPNSMKGSPYLTSPLVSPRLLSQNTSSNNNNTPVTNSLNTTIVIQPPITNTNDNSNTTSNIYQNSPQIGVQPAQLLSASTTSQPTPITASSSTSTSSTSLLSISSNSSISSNVSSHSNTSSPKPTKKSKSVFSKLIKEGTKRLVTKFSDKKDSDSEESPSTYILVYRGNGDESWRVKINQSTTVKELLGMLSLPQFLKLYLSNSLNYCNCNNNQNNNNTNCNINNNHNQDNVKCNNCNQVKLIEKELNEDDKILYAQKKWISSGATSTPPLFVLKSNLVYTKDTNTNNNHNSNSNNNSLNNSSSNLFSNNSLNVSGNLYNGSKQNTPQHYLLNNNYSGRYSICSIASESSDHSNSSNHNNSSNTVHNNHINNHHINNIIQQQYLANDNSPNLSPWSSPMLISPTKSNHLHESYGSNSSNNGFTIPNFSLDNNVVYDRNRTSVIINYNNTHNNNNNNNNLHGESWKNAERPRTGIRWINSNDINLIKNIGSGSFSKVYKAKYMEEIVAVKILNGDITPEQIENFKKEYDVLSLISSPLLIKIYGACKENKLKMVMEYCQYGSLYNMMSHKKRFEIGWPLAFKWMRQAVEGINVLHTMTPKLVHRDIKSQNLLINSQFDLKVADFGLAKPTELQTNSNSTLKGTMAYCAPELYSNINYTEKSDVYSLGIVLWELTTRCLTGRYHRPYEDHTGISFDFQIVIMTSKQGIRPTMPNNVPINLYSLITKCWHQDPNERPTCQQVLLAIRSLYDDFISDPNAWNSLLYLPNNNNNSNHVNNN